MRRVAIILLAPLAAVPVLGQEGPTILTPAQIGQIFCLGRIGNDMAPVEGLLTPDLGDVIAQAWARNDAWAAANPGDKPPLGDGIPWQAWQDYAPRCTARSASYEMDEARVWLDYVFPETPRAEFTDTLHLKLIPGPDGWNVWRIDNVSFASGSDLRAALAAAFIDN